MKTKAISADEAAKQLGVEVKRAISRLVFLGYRETCERCGGCGQYSFNGTHSICYGCSGSGFQSMRLTQEMIDEAKTRIAAGELQPYFDRCAMVARAKKISKAGWDFWHNSTVGKEYTAHQTPMFDNEEERKAWYAVFFASPLFIINKQVGALVQELADRCFAMQYMNVIKDAAQIEKTITRAGEIMERLKELDALYTATK